MGNQDVGVSGADSADWLQPMTSVVGQLFIFIAFALLTGCGNSFEKWEVTKTSSDISWAKFEWTNGLLGGRPYERVTMNIPCSVAEIPNPLTFQLDLGANLTGLYENTIVGLYPTYPELLGKIKTRNSKISHYENLNLNFGDYSVTNSKTYVYNDYGNLQSSNSGDTIHLGTIGADIFQNKVLIIDYPNKQFAICETVPSDYTANLIDITLDEVGRVILPMSLDGKSFRILFDTGSSLFPIITSMSNSVLFSTSPVVDTIQVYAWGKLRNVTGRVIDSPVILAGQTFSHVKVYTTIDDDVSHDGITGNILFWDKTVVIDFKNKKFGVKW
ncbi:hypothetical protein BH10BAC4_BH10BAC4_24900 [soil metagenome]